jgi:sirohydrochlorin ferrochelatase
MRRGVLVLAALCALAMPPVALANEGILLLAHNGSPEWNTQVKELVTKVDAQKPAEIAFGSPTRSTIAAAVDRLVKRGVTEVSAVPFLLSMPISPEDLTGHAVPVSVAPAPDGDQVFTDIIISRAEEIIKGGGEVLVLVGYGGDDAGASWVVDLAPLAQRLNRARRFASILTIPRPDSATEIEQTQIRLSLERQVASGRSIVVVPMMISANGPDPSIAQRLRGFQYEVAERGVIPDDRLVQWVAGQRPARASGR